MRPVRFVVEIMPYDNDIRYYTVHSHAEDIFSDLDSGYGALFTPYTICHNNYAAGHLTVGDNSLLIGVI